MNARIVNLRFKCCGLRFDAAIDCDWELHCYNQSTDERKDVTPIELYCMDKPEWDIRMIYYKEKNDEQKALPYSLTFRTCADADYIKQEARKWVREMINKKTTKTR